MDSTRIHSRTVKQLITEQKFEHIRAALQREFISRSKKNPAYSLRGFARYLEIDQSFLSKLLRGERPITKKFAETVAPKIGVNRKQISEIISAGTNMRSGFLSLSDDEFELLSEWYHFAIIELSKTKNFKFDVKKIASRLDIHVEEVRGALERLNRLGFIKITGRVLKVLSPNTTWTNNAKTSVARKQFQRKLIEKSLVAIEQIPFELRDNSSLTLAINKKRLPEFKNKLKKMRQELADEFQSGCEKDLDEVYQLTLAFFPLTITGE